MSHATVIGGGLAGVEAAMQLVRRSIPVTMYEMKPQRFSPAHTSPALAELVCSNSFKAARVDAAAGLLKAEMRLFGSVCLDCADRCAVPAGGALAVDRDAFSRLVTLATQAEPLITLVREEVTVLPDDEAVIVAAGPLVSDALAQKLHALCGGLLSFYDAAAPIITADSVDKNTSFTQSRYDRGGADDYINCPMNKQEYEAFYDALIHAQSADLHAFDTRRDVYEGCMPVEVMAARGPDTLRFGPLRPVGLRDPRTGHRPWAVLQLRREDAAGRLLNLVGFQTNLKFGEQQRVFSLIPALRNAEFVRYGVMHRNTFIDSPRLLDADFSLRGHPHLFFAGQITGVEGYMESAASGILAGIHATNRLRGLGVLSLPPDTMLGALAAYLRDKSVKNFQPMGANFGLLPPLTEPIRDKKQRYAALAQRALTRISEVDKCE